MLLTQALWPLMLLTQALWPLMLLTHRLPLRGPGSEGLRGVVFVCDPCAL
jgi:hypothetical protein